MPGGGRDPLQAVAAVTRLRRHALAESVRWGEPYLFLLADGIVSWVVALVDGERVAGGLCGGEAASAVAEDFLKQNGFLE